jgi:glycosyltransferase involved in cell wall biosynthesis
LIYGLGNEGIEFTVFYFSGEELHIRDYEETGVQCVKVSIRSIKKVLREVRKVNIIHAHLQKSEIIGYLLSLITRKRLVISKHNDYLKWPRNPWIERLIFSITGARASHVICISKNVQDFAYKSHGINRQKLRLIYYGFNRENFQRRLPYKYIQGGSPIRIGTLSRLHPQKGLDILIRAIEPIVNAELHVYGEGPLKSALFGIIEELNLRDRVFLHGKTEDVISAYEGIDLFVLASRYEGLGLVLLEAMSMKVPIIGSSSGAIPEILNDSSCIFRSADIEHLRCRIEDFMNLSPSEIDVIISRQQERLDDFSMQRMIDSTLDVYNECGNI